MVATLQGPHLAEHASTSRTPGHDTQPKARGAPSLTGKPKDTGAWEWPSAGRSAKAWGRHLPCQASLETIRGLGGEAGQGAARGLREAGGTGGGRGSRPELLFHQTVARQEGRGRGLRSKAAGLSHPHWL